MKESTSDPAILNDDVKAVVIIVGAFCSLALIVFAVIGSALVLFIYVQETDDDEGYSSSYEGSPYGDPVGFWRFEEVSWSSSSGEVRDSSGRSNHGTAVGPVRQDVEGVSGKAAYFNSGGHILIGSEGDMDITGKLTISAWIKTSSHSTYIAIVDKHHLVRDMPEGAIESGFSFYLTDGKLRFTIYSLENGQRSAMGEEDLRDGKWHHVAGVWDQMTIKVYADGELISYSEWPHDLTSSPVPLTIGIRSEGWGGYMPFKGTMDEVSIYHSALYDHELFLR
ncbi:MAG: LamG domain-containing protein [Candidatus Thermoplasmatota archaeon]|nr:LamG domain-containing protein [Candidatus Thermoplasmatota archaeon]